MKKTDIEIKKDEEINIHLSGYGRYITIFEKKGKLYINHLGRKMTLQRLYDILDFKK